eukprot:969251-Pelagomonas_calceolata.AAC.2
MQVRTMNSHIHTPEQELCRTKACVHFGASVCPLPHSQNVQQVACACSACVAHVYSIAMGPGYLPVRRQSHGGSMSHQDAIKRWPHDCCDHAVAP